jgi:hypothetical protein
MNIRKHDHKDRIVLELEESEFACIAHVIHKAHLKAESEKVVEESIPKRLHELFQKYIKEEY